MKEYSRKELKLLYDEFRAGPKEHLGPQWDNETLAIERKRTRNHDNLTKIIGRKEDVMAYVRYRVRWDTWTTMYDHMALKITKLIDYEDGWMMARLYKTTYAGD